MGKVRASLAISIVLIFLLAACQPATPTPILSATTDTELTLAPDQTITITDAGLAIHLIGVAGDQRCPSGMECAASGPVSISLTVQMGDEEPTDVNLQTFTDQKGLSPDMKFEGIENHIVLEGYLLQVVGVLPYPVKSTKEIKDSEYRVTFKVSKE
jgi:hypothetical protein